MFERYVNQARLLVRILPDVARLLVECRAVRIQAKRECGAGGGVVMFPMLVVRQRQGVCRGRAKGLHTCCRGKVGGICGGERQKRGMPRGGGRIC